MDRAEILRQNINRETAYGIEIGPFYNPIAPKAMGWNTTIVDYTDYESLRHIAENHNVDDIRKMAGNIEPVDVVWRDLQLDDACLKIRPDGFDYLIASHVIEHVPDIISFLKQISALSRPGFVLSLAIPDCRMTFDFFKPVSQTSAALAAYREKRMIHSPETLFDAYAYMTFQGGAAVWLPNGNGPLGLVEPLTEAHRKYRDYVQASADGTQTYVDAHCWYFTPRSFELMILELNILGYTDFSITHLAPGEGSEFYAQLQKQPLELQPHELHEHRLALMIAIRRELAETTRYLPFPSLTWRPA